jgi:hypothetical protein
MLSLFAGSIDESLFRHRPVTQGTAHGSREYKRSIEIEVAMTLGLESATTREADNEETRLLGTAAVAD